MEPCDAVYALAGIGPEERTELANLYAPGQTLWRVERLSFSAFDCNMPKPDGCKPGDPGCDKPDDDKDKDDDDDDCEDNKSSVVEIQNQILHESVGVVGTPYTLTYSSDRTEGRKAAYDLTIPLTGAVVPANLNGVALKIEIAGQTFTQFFACPCAPDDSFVFQWNGRDAFGRLLQGRQPVYVTIGHRVSGDYLEATSFGAFGGAPTGVATRTDVVKEGTTRHLLGTFRQLETGLGGWSLDVHHAYDPVGQVLYLGNGHRRSTGGAALGPVIQAIAGGNPASAGLGEGGLASDAWIGRPRGLTVGPDGSILFADEANHIVRKIDPAGIITTIAGIPNIIGGFSGDGGPATLARLNTPRDVALGQDGSVYIADRNNHRIRRIAPDGIITTVAGSGPTGIGGGGFSGDGGPATSALLKGPESLAVGVGCGIFVTDATNRRVRRVSPDGLIHTAAGGGALAIPAVATDASLGTLRGIDFGPDGSLYIADQGLFGGGVRILRLGLDGVLESVAGAGPEGTSGDGGPATVATIRAPQGLAVAPNGSIVFSGQVDSTVAAPPNIGGLRVVGSGGIIQKLAGRRDPNCPVSGYCGELGAALRAQLVVPWGVSVGPVGDAASLYVTDSTAGRIFQLRPPLPDLGLGDVLLPNGDATQVYVFSAAGKHLETRHALLGTTLLSFGYDAQGLLETITNGDGLITTIVRDAQGAPVSIVAPFGQVTALTTDANAYLASIQNPAGETVTVGYSADGLVQSFTNPRQFTTTYTHDGSGRLTGSTDPVLASRSFTRSSVGNGHLVARTTPLGVTTSYGSRTEIDGSKTRVNTFPSGTQSSVSLGADGLSSIVLASGTQIARTETPDPRFSLLSPLSDVTVTTPAALSRATTHARDVTLGVPADFLSLQTQNDTTTDNGLVATAEFTKALSRQVSTSPLGRQTSSVVDAQGRIVNVTIAGVTHPVSFTYNPQGQLVATAQGGRTSSFAYDALGSPATTTNVLGQTTTFGYDAAGRMTVITRADTSTIGFGYDAAGNRTSVTPSGKPSHLFSYTSVDLLESYTAPDAGLGPAITSYSYNTNRQLTQVFFEDATNAMFSYTPASGKLVEITVPGGTMQLGYEAATGRLSSVNGPYGVGLAYGYDGNLLTDISWIGAVSGSLHLDYDPFFRVAAESINGEAPISFSYDADGLLTQAGDMALTYNPLSALLTSTSLQTATDAFVYDDFGRITSYTAKFGAAMLFDVSFLRDELGRITQKTETVEGQTHSFTYSYDLVGQLSSVGVDGVPMRQYVYDDNGNRLQLIEGSTVANGAYDNQDRVLSYGDTAYSYNPRGQLTSKNNTVTAEVTLYKYDVLGNLLNVTLPDGTFVEYLIDGNGRRVGKKVNGSLVKQWVYGDDLRIVAELDGTGNMVSRFVWARDLSLSSADPIATVLTRLGLPPDRLASPGGVSGGRVLWAPVYMLKGGSTYRLFLDPLGSVRLVVDDTTGFVAQRIDYDEFGQVLSDSNPGFQPIGFAGGLYDGVTGLVRFGARDYDAEIGRWTSKDPIRFLGGDENLYGYNGRDPINLSDPAGMGAAAPPGSAAGGLSCDGGTEPKPRCQSKKQCDAHAYTCGNKCSHSGTSGCYSCCSEQVARCRACKSFNLRKCK